MWLSFSFNSNLLISSSDKFISYYYNVKFTLNQYYYFYEIFHYWNRIKWEKLKQNKIKTHQLALKNIKYLYVKKCRKIPSSPQAIRLSSSLSRISLSNAPKGTPRTQSDWISSDCIVFSPSCLRTSLSTCIRTVPSTSTYVLSSSPRSRTHRSVSIFLSRSYWSAKNTARTLKT